MRVIRRNEKIGHPTRFFPSIARAPPSPAKPQFPGLLLAPEWALHASQKVDDSHSIMKGLQRELEILRFFISFDRRRINSREGTNVHMILHLRLSSLLL